MLKERLYTVHEVAQMLNYKDETVRKWLRHGKLKGKKILDGWRIPESELQKLLEESDTEKERVISEKIEQ